MLGYTTKETMAKSGKITRGTCSSYEINLGDFIPIDQLVKMMADAPHQNHFHIDKIDVIFLVFRVSLHF